jgi:hypothetical protein
VLITPIFSALPLGAGLQDALADPPVGAAPALLVAAVDEQALAANATPTAMSAAIRLRLKKIALTGYPSGPGCSLATRRAEARSRL